jgi:hypothetical protein
MKFKSNDFCTYLPKGTHKPFDPSTLAQGLANEEKKAVFIAHLVRLFLAFWPNVVLAPSPFFEYKKQ